jgi:hypothetical protein
MSSHDRDNRTTANKDASEKLSAGSGGAAPTPAKHARDDKPADADKSGKGREPGSPNPDKSDTGAKPMNN